MERYQFKRILHLTKLIWLFFCLSISLIMSVLPFIVNILLGNDVIEVFKYSLKTFIDSIITLSLITFGIIFIVCIIIYLPSLILRKRKIKTDNLYRDIPKNYTVAVASILYDNHFENIKDIPALIVSLINKGMLKYDLDTNSMDSHNLGRLFSIYLYVRC